MAKPRKGTAAPTTGRPKKADDDRKDALVRVRVTEEQRRLFATAAARAGLDVSAWLRMLGMREAQGPEEGGDGR